MVAPRSVNGEGKDTRADTPLRLSEHVRYVRMGDQVIVADMRSGRYLGLDDVGARIWDMIDEGATRVAIVEHVSDEYDVSVELLERDVERLIRDLLKRRLIEQDGIK